MLLRILRRVEKGVRLIAYVTFNDIPVIYVTARRCAGGLKKLDLRSGSQRQTFLRVLQRVRPSIDKWGPTFVYGYSENHSEKPPNCIHLCHPYPQRVIKGE